MTGSAICPLLPARRAVGSPPPCAGGSGRSSGNVIDARGSRSGGGMPGGRVALPGGLGIVGVIVVIALQLLGGGSAYSVPSAFDDGVAAPDARGIPPDQDPERDLRDFSAYVFDNAQAMWAAHVRAATASAKLVLYRQAREHRLRLGELGRRPVLLPGRRARVPRPQLLRRHGAPARRAGRLRVGLRDRARGRPPRAEACAGRATRCAASSARTRATPTRCRSGSSSRPTATRASGRTPCSRRATSSPATSTRRSRASEAVGDDRLQRRAGGDVNPDSFTHGTSEQRARWFRTGQDGGEPAACDTFSADDV